MIDIERVRHQFYEYVKNFDIDDEQIKLKISHTCRVAKLSNFLATSLNLDQNNILLAEVIGWLHDIGRFEQITKYHTFIDRDSVNHGELGVKILFEDEVIRRFIDDTQYDLVIKTAILNHNKPCIDSNLEGLELLHSKIIRDSDKTDILYLSSQENQKDIVYCKNMLSDNRISDEVYYNFIIDKKIDYQNLHSCADIVLCHFAYIFDYNFPVLLKYINEKGYIDKIYELMKFEDIEDEDKFYSCYQLTKSYLRKRIK